MRGKTGCCLDCGRRMSMWGRQLCSTCWRKNDREGTLEHFPLWPEVLATYEDYLMVMRYDPSLTYKQRAARLGVTPRAIARYEAHRAGRRRMKSLEMNEHV